MTAPKEITTPPTGYEWTGEVRVPKENEPFADWHFGNGCWIVALGAIPAYGGNDRQPILRKVKPPTVTVPDLPREWIEAIVDHKCPVYSECQLTVHHLIPLFRAALEAEGKS